MRMIDLRWCLYGIDSRLDSRVDRLFYNTSQRLKFISLNKKAKFFNFGSQRYAHAFFHYCRTFKLSEQDIQNVLRMSVFGLYEESKQYTFSERNYSYKESPLYNEEYIKLEDYEEVTKDLNLKDFYEPLVKKLKKSGYRNTVKDK